MLGFRGVGFKGFWGKGLGFKGLRTQVLGLHDAEDAAQTCTVL